MRAVILSIGNELLRGDIADTNAAFLARQLSRLGFGVQRVEAVGDDLGVLQQALRLALETAEVTICTGGLGPTRDDLTRQAIASTLGQELVEDPELVAELESRFAAMGRRMPARNRQQATLIRSAEAIPNPNGTAPGWLVQCDGRLIAAMPGPPGEMQPMWNDWVQPRLESLLHEKPAMLSLMTFGLGESAVEERIDDVIHWRPDITIATYAKATGVEVHVTAHARESSEAARLALAAAEMLRERLGDTVFGRDDDTLSSVVGRLLDEQGLSLAVMESATGGALASLVTDSPGSSKYFRGGIVAYSRTAKAMYGVDIATMDVHGLISPETAISMSHAARRQFGADVGLGVTGVAGLEQVEGRAPGTVFLALSMGDDEEVRKIHRPGRREVIKGFAAQCALDLLRRHLHAGTRQTA